MGACLVRIDEVDAARMAEEIKTKWPKAREGAEWVGAAARKAHELGCNPGGEMAMYKIPAGHPMLQFYRTGVLMDKATIQRIDAEIEKAAIQ